MELSEDERRHIRHMYRANLATVDRTLGPILELARADGTLLVVTSDHGEGLGEHGFYGHGPSVFRENLHIPLIVRGAGVEIGVDDGVTSTVDLRPTLVELCELVEPLETARDGHSLVARLQGAPAPVDPPPVYFSGRYGSGPDPASGAIVRGWSVFVDASGAPHAFDLSSDPIEAKDRGAGDQAPDDIREQLRAIGDRQARYAHLGAVPMGAAPKLTDADEADLRALGYAGD
jgi:arylsulfatase A-like enzyme